MAMTPGSVSALPAAGTPADMKMFTKRNALLGALVASVARKRIERKLNRLAGRGQAPRRRRLLIGAGALSGLALAVGAFAARRGSPADTQVA